MRYTISEIAIKLQRNKIVGLKDSLKNLENVPFSSKWHRKITNTR